MQQKKEELLKVPVFYQMNKNRYNYEQNKFRLALRIRRNFSPKNI